MSNGYPTPPTLAAFAFAPDLSSASQSIIAGVNNNFGEGGDIEPRSHRGQHVRYVHGLNFSEHGSPRRAWLSLRNEIDL